jgi:sugar O-acyltransferase (sialic acid O-acetyltransferase NeuD family)
MNIVLFGTGGHAKVIAEIVELQGLYSLVGLVSQDGRSNNFIEGLDVIASNHDFKKILPQYGVQGAIIALGSNEHRIHLANLVGDNLEFVNAVHPSSMVSHHATLGPGTVVMAGATINPGTVIGSHCIINTSSSIDHDCAIGDFTHIAPGVVLAGHVAVGRNCFLGAGCVAIDHVSLGDNVIVAAGTTVRKNIPSGGNVDSKGIHWDRAKRP